MVDDNENEFSDEEQALAQFEADLYAAMALEEDESDDKSDDEETDDEEFLEEGVPYPNLFQLEIY